MPQTFRQLMENKTSLLLEEICCLGQRYVCPYYTRTSHILPIKLISFPTAFWQDKSKHKCENMLGLVQTHRFPDRISLSAEKVDFSITGKTTTIRHSRDLTLGIKGPQLREPRNPRTSRQNGTDGFKGALRCIFTMKTHRIFFHRFARRCKFFPAGHIGSDDDDPKILEHIFDSLLTVSSHIIQPRDVPLNYLLQKPSDW